MVIEMNLNNSVRWAVQQIEEKKYMNIIKNKKIVNSEENVNYLEHFAIAIINNQSLGQEK